MDWASKYIGLEYEPCGRGPRFDCYGLLRHVLEREFCLELPAHAGVESEDRAAACAEFLESIPWDGWREVAAADARPGDAVLLRIMGLPCHCGVCLENGMMLHIHKGVNAVVEKIDSVKWRNRVLGFYRPPGL